LSTGVGWSSAYYLYRRISIRSHPRSRGDQFGEWRTGRLESQRRRRWGGAGAVVDPLRGIAQRAAPEARGARRLWTTRRIAPIRSVAMWVTMARVARDGDTHGARLVGISMRVWSH